MSRPYALLRSGFPFQMTLGMRRVTTNPVGIALGSEDRVYVLCRGGLCHGIRIINFDDDNLGTWGGGELKWPVALLMDHEERLYVSDEAAHKILTFSKDGELLGSWGEQGSADGQFSRPSGMAFDADENIYVSDTLNHRIQKFTPDGEFLFSWGTHGDGDGEFNMPWGLAVDEVGAVYVADWRNDRIQKFTADGEFILKFGATGSEEGQFNRPSGVAVDKDGDIYVADWGNNRVQLFNPEALYVEKFLGDANLSRSARTYVLANPVTLRLRETSRLEIQRRLRGPISVTVDDAGRMYVADFGSHRIQVYQKEAYPLEEHQLTPVPRNPILQTT